MKLRQRQYLGFRDKSDRNWVDRVFEFWSDVSKGVPGWIWLSALLVAFVGGYVVPITLKFTAAGMVAVLVVFLASLDAKKSIYAIWFMLIAEGAIRKWILPGAQEFIYFAKDVLLVGIYMGTVLRGYLSQKAGVYEVPAPIRTILWVLVIYFVFELFNPRLANQVIGLFGLRNYLFYIAMVFVVPYLFESRKEFYKFLKVQFALSILVAAIGMLQYTLPDDHVLNQYANTEHKMDIAKVVDTDSGDGKVRITGTFSYITGYTSYLTILTLLIFPFFFASGQKERRLYIVPLAMLFGNILMAGSRAPVLIVTAAIPMFIQLATFDAPDRAEAKIVRRRLYFRFAIVAVFVLISLATVFREPLKGVMGRFDEHDDEAGRVEHILTTPFKLLEETGMFGWGPAMTHQATPSLLRLTRTDYQLPPPGEDEPIRIIKEIGFAGFVLWYVMRFLFLGWNWYLIRKEKDSFFRLFLIAVFLIQGAALPTSTVVNHTQLFLYWFLLGAMRIPSARPALVRKRKRYLA